MRNRLDVVLTTYETAKLHIVREINKRTNKQMLFVSLFLYVF